MIVSREEEWHEELSGETKGREVDQGSVDIHERERSPSRVDE